jgi:hypothetical protein
MRDEGISRSDEEVGRENAALNNVEFFSLDSHYVYTRDFAGRLARKF